MENNDTYLANEIANYLDNAFIYDDTKADNTSINIVGQMLNSISIDISNPYTDIYKTYEEYNNTINDFKYEIKIDPVLKILSARIEFDIISQMLKILSNKLSDHKSTIDLDLIFEISKQYNYVLDICVNKIEEHDILKTLSANIKKEIDLCIERCQNIYSHRKNTTTKLKNDNIKKENIYNHRKNTTTKLKNVDFNNVIPIVKSINCSEEISMTETANFNQVVSISIQLRQLLNNLKKICKDKCDVNLSSSSEDENEFGFENNNELDFEFENKNNEFDVKNEKSDELNIDNKDNEFDVENKKSDELNINNKNNDKLNIDEMYTEYNLINSQYKELIIHNPHLTNLLSKIEYYLNIY